MRAGAAGHRASLAPSRPSRNPPPCPAQERTLLLALEGRAAQALGFPWDRRVDAQLLDNLGKYRRRD